MVIEQLMNMASKKVVHDGQIIVREGSAMGNEMYIILMGEVVIYKNYGEADEVQLSVLSKGEFFGEMTLFLNRERSATVVSRGTVILIEINRINAYEFFEKQPEATYSLIKALCVRLDTANNQNVTKLTGRIKTESPAPAAKTVAAAKTQQPAPAPEVQMPQKKSAREINISMDLFPDGHKNYTLEIELPLSNVLVERSYVCPVCDNKFRASSMRTTNLRVEKMDNDFRMHYNTAGDTIHYDIITCPDCYYSTFGTSFNTAVIPALVKNISVMRSFKENVRFPADFSRDINSIFAGFYLALKSASLFYLRAESTIAKVWLRLVWLYRDCGDEKMEGYAISEAHKAYLRVFEMADLGPEALQQLNITLGELSFKLNDLTAAKKYFFAAKTSKSGKPVMAQQADDRLTEIRELEKKQDESES